MVRDPVKRAASSGGIPDWPWVGQGPVFMVWVGDSRRIRRICEMRGKPFANDHPDSFLNAAADCALAMQTFILSAEAAGLGCCTISAVRSEEHTSEVQSLMRISYAVFCLKKKQHPHELLNMQQHLYH